MRKFRNLVELEDWLANNWGFDDQDATQDMIDRVGVLDAGHYMSVGFDEERPDVPIVDAFEDVESLMSHLMKIGMGECPIQSCGVIWRRESMVSDGFVAYDVIYQPRLA